MNQLNQLTDFTETDRQHPATLSLYASELLPPVGGAKTQKPPTASIAGEGESDGGGGGGSATSPALALAVRSAYRSACPQVLEVLATCTAASLAPLAWATCKERMSTTAVLAAAEPPEAGGVGGGVGSIRGTVS